MAGRTDSRIPCRQARSEEMNPDVFLTIAFVLYAVAGTATVGFGYRRQLDRQSEIGDGRSSCRIRASLAASTKAERAMLGGFSPRKTSRHAFMAFCFAWLAGSGHSRNKTIAA